MSTMSHVFRDVHYPKKATSHPDPGCHLRAWSSLTVLSEKATKHHKPSVVLSVMYHSPTKELWLGEEKDTPVGA